MKHFVATHISLTITITVTRFIDISYDCSLAQLLHNSNRDRYTHCKYLNIRNYTVIKSHNKTENKTRNNMLCMYTNRSST